MIQLMVKAMELLSRKTEEHYGAQLAEDARAEECSNSMVPTDDGVYADA